MEAGKNNGLRPQQIVLADRLLKENILAKGKKKTRAKIYQEVINSNVSDKVADVKMADKTVGNGRIKKTILEVMESKSLNLTDDNLLKCHKKIRDKAINNNQLSTARSTNRDFLELKGLLKENITDNTTINNLVLMNVNKMTVKERDDKLLDIIKK